MESGFLTNETEAVMRRVATNELFWNPMTLVILLPRFSGRRWRINDGEQSTGLQRAKQSAKHRVLLPHLVIRIHNQHDIQFFLRQLWIVFRPQNRFNLYELFALRPLANLFYFLFQ